MNEHSSASAVYDAIETGKDARYVARLLEELLLAEPGSGVERLAQMHPLGFFAISWPLDQLRVLRLHYWNQAHEWSQSGGFHIHDHVFDLTSLVVAGELRNETFSVVASEHGHPMYVTTYTPQGSALVKLPGYVSVKLSSSIPLIAQKIYKIPARTFHRTLLESESALTVLATRYATPERSGARVVGDGDEEQLTFSRAPSESIRPEELVLAIRTLLTEARR